MGSFTQDYIQRLRDMPVTLLDGKTVKRHLYLINDNEAFVCIDKGYHKVTKTNGQWIETHWTDADNDTINEPRFTQFAMFRQKGDRR